MQKGFSGGITTCQVCKITMIPSCRDLHQFFSEGTVKDYHSPKKYFLGGPTTNDVLVALLVERARVLESGTSLHHRLDTENRFTRTMHCSALEEENSLTHSRYSILLSNNIMFQREGLGMHVRLSTSLHHPSPPQCVTDSNLGT